ncbi:MAG TPA: SUF system NifU family Fe-S cluster assembly protein [Gammaproteobacteria bacterium]|nr:SUF system NifU family Fe-S cluster assembly protein [Gammaproteobacteria bacterium]
MDLKSLYQDIIVDHNRSPRNFRRIEGATRRIDGYNPLCGDRITLYVKLSGDVIEDVSFEGSGCAISTASASLMTETLKGRRVEEAEQLFQSMHDLLTREDSGVDPDSLGKLAALEGVRDYPSRVKCATLCWHTLHSALQGDDQPVTTE